MKKWIAAAVLLAMCSGCVTIPDGVKGAMYTTQITLKQTVMDAATADKYPWKMPENPTVAQQLTVREHQVILLVNTMEQAGKNLDAVTDYFRTGKEKKND